MNAKLKKKKIISNIEFILKRPIVFSRHPSHKVLRTALKLQRFRSVIRLGSTTIMNDGKQRVEINSVQGVKNSSSKLLMKQCFTRAEVKTAMWWTPIDNILFQSYRCNINYGNVTNINQLPYPIITKSLEGSRGRGNTKLDNQQALERWMQGKQLSNYIFEKFYDYSKEYRLHITNKGCFYTCRKLMKNEFSERGDWQRHDDNCTWILEDNLKFMKPSTWNLIVQDCIKAKNALGLDICAFDVLVQGSKKDNPQWIILESCSAPSHGTITSIKYIEELNTLLLEKYNNRR